MLQRPWLSAALVAFSLLETGQASAQTFQGLGTLEASDPASYGTACSADGEVVIGSANTLEGSVAFRWTEADGLQSLGDLPGGQVMSQVGSMSADGAVIGGWSMGILHEKEALLAFRWTAADGMQALGDLEGGEVLGVAQGVSADGTTLVGHSYPDINELTACYWLSDGVAVALPSLPGDRPSSTAAAVSGDGQVVVGSSRGAEESLAVRWVNGVLEALGDLPGGGEHSFAYDVSPDGQWVVGSSSSKASTRESYEAFRWSEAQGMQPLGDLPGGFYYSEAFAVSADGSVAVGRSDTDDGERAFVWIQGRGMQTLQAILEADGVTESADWMLASAYGLSDDGRTVVGTGISPEGVIMAFRATLSAEAVAPGEEPEPTPTPEPTATPEPDPTPVATPTLEPTSPAVSGTPAMSETPASSPTEEDTPGCGCDSGSGPTGRGAGWLCLGVSSLLFRRRQRREGQGGGLAGGC